jgi:hypothetical protein
MPDGTTLALIIVAIGILLGVAALLALRVRGSSSEVRSLNSPTAGVGMSLGMVLGALLGAIVWFSTGEFVFWVVFLGAGMTVGLAIGQSYSNRGR